MTIFLAYLLTLRHDANATILCQHFRRIAMQDTTESSTVTFLTGQPADVLQDAQDSMEDTGIDMHGNILSTTALHEAVKASNYHLVEYFVRTDFVVEAQDSNNETAFDIAVHMERSSTAKDPIKNKQIIALLQQNQATKVDSSMINSGLPLGWEPCQDHNADNDLQAWKETSIDSDHDAITFRTPKAGLWQDERIAFGQRQIEGKGQSYHLDPLRFLRSRSDHRNKPKAALEPHFGDRWYLEDIKTTSKSLTNPLLDGRAWYRNTAKAWLLLRTLLFRNFTSLLLFMVPISILARTRGWPSTPQIILHVSAMVGVMTGPLSAFRVQNVLDPNDPDPTRKDHYWNYVLAPIPHIIVGFLQDLGVLGHWLTSL